MRPVMSRAARARRFFVWPFRVARFTLIFWRDRGLRYNFSSALRAARRHA